MLNYILIPLSFSGLIIGKLISNFTKDELKQGERYFKLFSKLIIISLITFKVFFISWGYYYFLILGVIFGYFFKREYFYLGISLIASIQANIQFIVSTLIFMFGLPLGTLHREKLTLEKFIIIFIIFSLPVLITKLIQHNPEMFLAISAGALLWELK